MKFAVFIISHGRADRVETYTTLRKAGYTGEIFVIVDDEDNQLVDYAKRFTDELIIFHKVTCYIDTIYGREKSSAVYARNFVEDCASFIELDAFAVFDDDITGLR